LWKQALDFLAGENSWMVRIRKFRIVAEKRIKRFLLRHQWDWVVLRACPSAGEWRTVGSDKTKVKGTVQRAEDAADTDHLPKQVELSA